MKTILYRIWSKFLIIFGEIKLVKWFPWIQYDPVEYKVTGDIIMSISNFIKPGDVVLRSYDGYIDNWFIDGKYSHIGIYIGNDELIHAVNPKVEKINLIDFCRCDHLCVLRPNGGTTKAIATAGEYLENNVPYDFAYKTTDDELYCFELVANCYRQLNIQTKQTQILLGLIKRNAYLCDSFLDSPDFIQIYES